MVYKNSEQFYGCIQNLFERLQTQDPRAMQAIQNSRLIFHLVCTKPQADIILDGRRRPAQIRYGATPARADLTINLETNVFHEILLDKRSLKKSFANGAVKVKGPVFKTFALAEFFHRGRAHYPHVLRQHGLL